MPAVFEAEWNSRNDEHKTKRPQDLRLSGAAHLAVPALMLRFAGEDLKEALAEEFVTVEPAAPAVTAASSATHPS